jgi:predicted RNase H-like HicB family nuclease
MGPLRHTIQAVVRLDEEGWYVAECLELAVVTQGRTLDEAIANLQEATALHLEGEDLRELGLAPAPTVIVSMEVEPVRA